MKPAPPVTKMFFGLSMCKSETLIITNRPGARPVPHPFFCATSRTFLPKGGGMIASTRRSTGTQKSS